jgi:hypothetical protein
LYLIPILLLTALIIYIRRMRHKKGGQKTPAS